MKNKIVIFNIVIITLAMLAVFFFGISANRTSHYKEAEKRVIEFAAIYEQTYDGTNSVSLTEDVPEDVRVTIVSADGVVVADSRDKSLAGSSHADREEIKAAFSGEPKIVTRYSDTLKKDMLYYAIKVDDGSFIRVAIAVESVEDYVKSTVPTMLFVTFISLVVAYVAGVVATDGIVKPLSDVKAALVTVKNCEFKESIPHTGDKEINDILTEINVVSDKLQKTIKESTAEKERLGYLLGNISDGIVALDSEGNISEINGVAEEIFSVRGVCGKSFSVLAANKTFNARIKKCVDERSSDSFEYEADGKAYICTAKTLEAGYTVLVLSDITAVKNAEKNRSEFFANASHELKTPLTAVKGFNDVIALQTKEKTTAELSAKIDKEIERIIKLINDMLGLSKLEAETEPKDAENIDIAEIAREVKESLAPIAEKKNVSVTIIGGGTVKMEREHAVELVKNLVENGIRYNRDGGFVKVEVKKAGDKTVLTVTDNGIGIEEEHLNRIFERFYRVSKSRSAETGGTGLGLSIVKHVCGLYNAELTLDSKYGEGTRVTVSFGK